MLEIIDLHGHEITDQDRILQLAAYGFSQSVEINMPGAPNHGQIYDLSFVDRLDPAHLVVQQDDSYKIEIRRLT